MRLPSMKYTENRSQKNIIQFLGVNYGENTRDGEFAETKNLSSRMFPCLSQRPGREDGASSYANATAVWYKDGLMVVDGTDLIYKGEKVGTVSPGKKQFANVNTKIVVFPDKVMYDTATGEMRGLEAEFVSQASAVEFTDDKTMLVHLGAYQSEPAGSGSTEDILYELVIVRELIDGPGRFPTPYYVVPFEARISDLKLNSETGELTYTKEAETVYAGASTWKEGDLFIDSSLGLDGVTSWGKVTKVHSYYHYDVKDQPIGGLERYFYYYVKYSYDRYEVKGTSYGEFTGFEGMNFKAGDTVEISGCSSYPANNKVATVRAFAKAEEEDGTLYGLIFDAETFPQTGVEAGAVTVKRSVPDLTVICEQDNRLYGATGDTIYVSALGDPTNFNTFDGVDTDSYAVAVATEGDFTGCIGYGSSVLFFKEDCLHKLMGSYPSQYTLYDYTVPGVKAGSEGSLWNINEVVCYHGREGVYRYSGGSPELISGNFGLRRFEEASAGAEGSLYYISMRDKKTGAWGLWVYDMMTGIWLQEDNTRAVDFARDGGKLYCIDGEKNRLVLLNPEESEEEIAWEATLCRMNEVYLNRKCYSKILMRLELEDGAEVKIEVSCDHGPWVEHQMFRKGEHRTVLVPVRPNRCDSFQIRLSGTGRAVIRALVREFELGSDY